MHPLKSILIEILLYKKMWLVIFIPICYLPIPIYYPDSKGKCAYVVLWMCSYWTTEALPMAIAGLLPCLVMPMLSLIKIEELAMEYIKDTSLLFIGGIAMAMGIEKCNLHKRVALNVLRVAGAPARRVAFGFMGTAWFLSMWMNNTATTTMMVPLVRAIVAQLRARNPQVTEPVRPSWDDRRTTKTFTRGDTGSTASSLDHKDDHIEELIEKLASITRTSTSQIQKAMASESFRSKIKQIIEERGYNQSPTSTEEAKLSIKSNADSLASPPLVTPPQMPPSPPQIPASPSQTHSQFHDTVEPPAVSASPNRTLVQILKRAVDNVNPFRRSLKSKLAGDKERSLNFARILERGSSTFVVEVEQSEFDLSVTKLTQCLLCGVAYSSTLGGTTSLIGTSPNLILKAQIATVLAPDVITFTNWIVMALPLSLMIFIITWMWLVYYFMGKNEFLRIFGIERGDGFIEVLGEEAVKEEYKKLGPMSYAEKNVASLFVILIVLWVTRDPGFISGWGSLFKEKYVSDTQPALLIAFLLFILPSKNIFCVYKWNRGVRKADRRVVRPLMDWKTFSGKMPWDILFLLGGGFALAKTIRTSELDVTIAETFERFRDLPPWILVMVLCAITCITTEIASNVATASIYLPIVAYMSGSLKIHPLYLMIPICLSCSFSFMLPVGTPPNSIAYSFGEMEVLTMMKVGCVVSFVSQILIQIFLNTWIRWTLQIP